MAVFTPVRLDQAQQFFAQLDLGRLLELQGIESGIENSNFFATTTRGAFVLTLFERLQPEQLPFYLEFMRHLAAHGIPVPDPMPDAQGHILHSLCGRPAAVVTRLRGRSVLQPEAAHCAQVGLWLARMHLAAQDYPGTQPNLRGLDWQRSTIPAILPFLDADQGALLSAELAHQGRIAQSAEFAALPRSAVHADLFRDNALFEGKELSGIFDFYFAGVDTWMFDLAVTLNDWCIHPESGVFDPVRRDALLHAYAQVRPLLPVERPLLPDALRAAALRFWTSRLADFYLPRDAHLLTPHDPTHFERVLRRRIADPLQLAA